MNKKNYKNRLHRFLKQITQISISAFICVFYLHLSVFAAFEDLGVGARPTGMGNAFVGVADDVHAVFYNPAGLVQLKKNEFTTSYGKLFMGLKDKSNITNSFAAYGNPLGKSGAFGIGYLNLNLPSLYSETTFMLSYGYKFKRSFSAGLTIKALHKGYGKNAYTEDAINDLGQTLGSRDPVFQYGYSTTKLSADIGLLYNFPHKFGIGLAATNIIEPNVAVSRLGTDKVKRQIKIGFAYRPKSLLIAAGAGMRGKDMLFSAGFEGWFLKQHLGVRMGMGFGSREFKQAAFGFSYKISMIQFDYTMVYPLGGISGTMGTHRVSLSFRFGPWPLKLPTEEEELLRSIGKLPPRPPTTEEIKRAGDLYRDAIGAMRIGLYTLALSSATTANKLNPDDTRIKQGLDRFKAIVSIIPQQTENTKEGKLIRNGVNRFFENDAKKAINSIWYAVDNNPTNLKLQELLKLLKAEFPEEGARVQIGINLIELRLEEALENIYNGKYLAAIGLCNEILELDERNVMALTRQGSAYWALGDRERAQEVWRKALTIDPTNEILLEFIKETGIKIEPKKGEVPKKPEPLKPKTYKVERGDTLPAIAEKFYGDRKQWRKIYEANTDTLPNPYQMIVGQELKIP